MPLEDAGARYPGVMQAYDFVIPSYGWMLTRMEAANGRIQSMQTFVASFTFAVPAVAKILNPNLSFVAARYLMAMVAFAVLMLIGLMAGTGSRIKLVNPNLLFETWLHYPEWEFKKNAIAWAGEHFQFNVDLLQSKANAAKWMTAFFLLELVFLLAWIATS